MLTIVCLIAHSAFEDAGSKPKKIGMHCRASAGKFPVCFSQEKILLAKAKEHTTLPTHEENVRFITNGLQHHIKSTVTPFLSCSIHFFRTCFFFFTDHVRVTSGQGQLLELKQQVEDFACASAYE